MFIVPTSVSENLGNKMAAVCEEKRFHTVHGGCHLRVRLACIMAPDREDESVAFRYHSVALQRQMCKKGRVLELVL